MKKEIIHITKDGRIVIPAVHPDKIRMDEAELVGLFNIVAPTLRAAKRRIYNINWEYCNHSPQNNVFR